MDLNDTAVFVQVAKAGSFTAAARLLDTPVSTISNRIARLEKHLQVTLLQRTTRRMHLTDAGKLYLDHASAGLDYFQAAEEAVNETCSEPGGLLRVTAPADLGDHILAAIVQRMSSLYPKVNIELVLMNRYIDLVAEGIDVAIRTGELEDSTLIARNAGSARWSLFASKEYLASCSTPLDSPEALRQHRCLQFTPMGRDAWTFTHATASVTVPLPCRIMINDVGVLRTMLSEGGGVALLPTYLCRGDASLDNIVPVLPEWVAREDPVNIVYPQQRFVPPRLRAFIDVALQELGDWLAPGS